VRERESERAREIFVFILFSPLALAKLLQEAEAASLRKKRVFEIWVQTRTQDFRRLAEL
jgi:hypothetical protein